GGHVDRVVQAAVAALGQPVHDPAAGGHLDRGGAGVGRERVAAGEPGDVLDVADDGGGDDRADAVDAGQGGAGGFDGVGEREAGVAELQFQVVHVGDVHGGELVPGPGG